jgi:N utilization substance protein A
MLILYEEFGDGMRNELIMAVNQICAEKALQRDVVIDAIEAALVSAYKRNFGATGNVMVKIDQDSGQLRVFAQRQVVENVVDSKNEITLAGAKAIDKKAELGDIVNVETTPANFGRIAAQTAKQVILQRIREAEREATYKTFADKENEIVSGTVQRIDHASGDVTVGLERGEAILSKAEQIPNERYRVNGRIRAFLMEVHRGTRGPLLKLSRTHKNMLRRLLELEVPEIANGTVEIKSIAREPGQRSKVAVAAAQYGIDPVGSCVGMRGVRIQNIVNELNGEKIDVVEWSPEVRTFITNALSPAKVNDVYLDDSGDAKTAVVVVPDRQLSLAIGKEGQNARLAAKLTGWRIDIKSETEAIQENVAQTFIERARQAVLAPDRDILALAEQILRERTGTVVSEAFPDSIPAVTEPELPPVDLAPVTAHAEPLPESAGEEVLTLQEEIASEQTSVVASDQAATSAEAATAEIANLETVPYREYQPDFIGDKPFEYDEGSDADRKKKKSKKTRYVFDETRGEVVSVRRHKREQHGWGEFEDE